MWVSGTDRQRLSPTSTDKFTYPDGDSNGGEGPTVAPLPRARSTPSRLLPTPAAVSAVLETSDHQTIDVALVRGQAVSMVRSLVGLCGSFYKPSPAEARRVCIHLFYNASCPPDYQPPMFEDNTNAVHTFFRSPPLSECRPPHPPQRHVPTLHARPNSCQWRPSAKSQRYVTGRGAW